MVRGQVSVRLQRIQRVATKRGVAQRPTAVTKTTSGFIRRSRFAQMEVQEARQQQALNEIVSKISSLSNLNQINAVLNTAPSIIKSQVDQIRANITNQQNLTISKLQSDLASKVKSEDKYSSRRKKADKDSRDYERNKIKEEEYEAEISELNRLIGQMRAGNLYDYSSVISRVNDVGRNERKETEYYFDKKRAEEKAQKETIAKIVKEGLTPVVNANTGALIGYQGGKDTGFAEYRFDNKGTAQFYKSTRFTPVRSAGVITGYVDNVAKMSIPAPLLERHISNINKQAQTQTKTFTQFQGALKTIKLPTGYSFQRDKLGNIVSIDDKKRGINLDLGQLPNITTAYLFNPTLKRIFQASPKELFKVKGDVNYVKDLKWYEKFNPRKVTDYTYKRRYNFYKNNFGGKLSYSNFVKEQWKAPNKAFQNTVEGRKIVKALNKSLTDQIQNPEKYGTNARVSGLLTVGSAVALPSAGLILFGSTYFGTLGVAKDVSKAPLPKNFNSVAKVVAKNFGKGAVQGLLYGLAFKTGGVVLGKLGKPLLKVSFGARAGVISKATKLAIQRGLSILGVNYVSRLAGRTAFNIKNIAVGEAELGVGEISKDLGTLVGFAIPTVASKITRRKDITIKKKILELEKFRKGTLNSAYIKAKNAQLVDPARGEFKSSGIVKKLNKNSIKILSKEASRKGISRSQLLDGSYYVQNFKVRSDAPKYEALLKVAKARAKGKTIKIKSVPKFFTFKRYGVVVARQTKKGAVEAFAIEFNYANGRVSNIGFKTAIGKNKITAVKVYQKIRKVKGKPVRVKFKDLFLVKNKFETKIPSEKGMVRILNTLETKKVFLNKKQLSKNQLESLKSAIKRDFTFAKKPNVESILKKLYKNKGVTSKTGFSNVIRIQRTKNFVRLVPSTKKAPVGFKIYPKGQYIEVGYTKFRIPSIKKIRIVKPTIKPTKKIKPVKITRKPVTPRPIKVKPITIKQVKAPVRSLQIQVKRGVTKTKLRQVETAVKSIQTIVKPRIRAGKLTKVMPVSVTRTVAKQVGALLPLVATRNIQALRNIQSNLKVSANIQTGKQITKVQQTQIKSLQSASVNALKNISLVKPITPTIITPTAPKRKVTKPKKKPISIAKIPKPVVRKKVVRRVGELGFTSSLAKGKKKRDLNKIPISKEKAFDIVAYNLFRSRLLKGKVSKSTKEVKLSTLKRKVASIPTGFFRRNRSKFIVRRLKTRVESYEIEKRQVPRAKATPKRKPVRRKPVKRKPVKKKPIRRKPVKRKVNRPTKRKPIRKTSTARRRTPPKRKVRKPIKRKPVKKKPVRRKKK